MTDPKELELRLREQERQLEAAHARLERMEKLAVVGGLVSEIAHEINTPLAALRSNMDSLAVSIRRLRPLIGSDCRGPEGTHELQELLVIIEDTVRINQQACERVSTIVQGLRGASRKEAADFAPANLHVEIENSLRLLAAVIRNRIRLVKDFGALPEIDCDAGRLGQVFLNILVNAVQAIEGEGEIRIRTWQEGDTVRIAIRDTGKGIPAELQSRIFDPGFTTKSADKGTGIGLSISLNIIQQHGGRIDVESEEGRGSTFTVILPLQQPCKKEEQ